MVTSAAFTHPILPNTHALRRRKSHTQPVVCEAPKAASSPKRTLLSRNVSFLPLLVRTARKAWYTFWRLMMSELAPSDSDGRYLRPTSSLSALPPPLEPSKEYCVFVGVACQWCHRVMLARALLGISNVNMRNLEPGEDGLWRLADADGLLRDVYLEREPKYVGRFTAPLLVAERGGIVSNESADILHLLGDLGEKVKVDEDTSVWLRPPEGNDAGIDLKEMDAFCERLYAAVNDGVYRCGFATSQMAYEEAQERLFGCLDEVEDRLRVSRFLFSPNVITEADVRLFPTVFRFDAVYAVLFKACRKCIRADYRAISDWIRGKSCANCSC